MESLYFWVPMVLVLSGVGIAVYVWAVNDGQYDDLDREAQQMLMDDDQSPLKPIPHGLPDVETITSSRPQGTASGENPNDRI